MCQNLELLLNLSIDSWMRMAACHGANTSCKIKISLTSVVEKILHFTLNDHQRILVEVVCKITDVIFSLLQNFFVGFSFILSGYVFEGWDLHGCSLGHCGVDGGFLTCVECCVHIFFCKRCNLSLNEINYKLTQSKSF